MKISGLQKMTLLDYPGKVACTVFLGGCNFRCPFCHNSELLGQNAPQFIMADELFAFLQKRQGLLEAVCISGGEPTLQPKLSEFISKIKELNFLVKLDTNGYRPDVLRQLLEDGLLDYVAMDVKNDLEHYPLTCGLNSMDINAIQESLSLLLQVKTEYELRTTVVEQLHNADSFKGITDMLQRLSPEHKCQKYFLQPFVDRETVIYSNFTAPSEERLFEYKKILEQASEIVAIRGL